MSLRMHYARVSTQLSRTRLQMAHLADYFGLDYCRTPASEPPSTVSRLLSLGRDRCWPPGWSPALAFRIALESYRWKSPSSGYSCSSANAIFQLAIGPLYSAGRSHIWQSVERLWFMADNWRSVNRDKLLSRHVSPPCAMCWDGIRALRCGTASNCHISW